MTGHPLWRSRLGTPLSAVAFSWNRVEVGPARSWSGELLGPARTYDVPYAMRLDGAGGPVWFVAAIPAEGADPRPFVGGDEIVIAFEPSWLLEAGFPDDAFLK